MYTLLTANGLIPTYRFLLWSMQCNYVIRNWYKTLRYWSIQTCIYTFLYCCDLSKISFLIVLHKWWHKQYPGVLLLTANPPFCLMNLFLDFSLRHYLGLVRMLLCCSIFLLVGYQNIKYGLLIFSGNTKGGMGECFPSQKIFPPSHPPPPPPHNFKLLVPPLLVLGGRGHCTSIYKDHFASSEPEGRYHYSKMFCWEPEGRYCHRLCTAIAPFWFSTEHLWILIAPFWLSTDDMSRIKHC